LLRVIQGALEEKRREEKRREERFLPPVEMTRGERKSRSLAPFGMTMGERERRRRTKVRPYIEIVPS